MIELCGQAPSFNPSVNVRDDLGTQTALAGYLLGRAAEAYEREDSETVRYIDAVYHETQAVITETKARISALYEEDPFNAGLAAQDPALFDQYLSLVSALANGDEEARSKKLISSFGSISRAVVKAAGYEVEPFIEPTYPITQEQINLALDHLSTPENDYVAAFGLTTFGVSAASPFVLERAFHHFKRIGPTKDQLEEAWESETPLDALVSLSKPGRLGVDLGVEFAKLGLLDQASAVIRWNGSRHGSQFAVNAIAASLNNATEVATFNWAIQEFDNIDDPECNTDYLISVIAEKYLELNIGEGQSLTEESIKANLMGIASSH